MIQNVPLIAIILRKTGGFSPTWSICCANAKRTDLEQGRIITQDNYTQKRGKTGSRKAVGMTWERSWGQGQIRWILISQKTNLCTRELGVIQNIGSHGGRKVEKRSGAQRWVSEIASSRLQEEKKDKKTGLETPKAERWQQSLQGTTWLCSALQSLSHNHTDTADCFSERQQKVSTENGRVHASSVIAWKK